MFFENIFKQRPPKRFRYFPRFVESEQKHQGLPSSRFSSGRERLSIYASDHWKNIRTNYRNSDKLYVTLRLLIIVFVLSFIAYLILDFDFSLF